MEGEAAMTEYTVRLYFRGGMTLDVPIELADDEEPDLEWFLGESSDPEERTPVLSEGQFAWKSAEVIGAEWYEAVSASDDMPGAEAANGAFAPDVEATGVRGDAADDALDDKTLADETPAEKRSGE